MPEQKLPEMLIQEIHQGMYGVPHTDEKGVGGDIKEIKLYLKDHEGRIHRIETVTNVIKWVITPFILAIATALSKSFNWW